jgi:patatin-related protein
MPVSAVPRPPEVETKELRLALVCYGGVSLAIYMYGITKELHKLVRASAQTDGRGGGEPDPVEAVYAKALARADEAGNRTRVVIDVVAGTSAGGINGICLAKALARDASQDKLLDLWLSRGDIAKLVDLRPLLRSLPAPILSGKRMLDWVRQALDDMDAEADARGAPGSLMPDGHELELYVTTTDFGGYGARVPLSDPWGVTEPVHRHLFRFAAVGGRDGGTLGHRWNPALAFAARSTSSFPGAFPPVAISDLGQWEDQSAFLTEFFRPYPLANPEADPLASWFVDGGVLDNKPFDHALRAVFRKAAAVEVDRRLLFIEPDPGGRPPAGDGKPPSWRTTVWGALSKLPAGQPILDQLLLVRDFNERVARVRDVTAASRDAIADRVRPLLDGAGDWDALSQALVDDSAAFAGAGYIPYLRLKLHEVVERFAAAGAEIGGFPVDSSHAGFVREVVAQWARDEGILASSTEPTEAQLGFLRALDLSYRERRVLYAVALVNALYRTGEVDRKLLDAAKATLYGIAHELSDVLGGSAAGELGAEVRALLDPAEISRNLEPAERGLPARFEERVQRYAKTHADAIRRLRDGIQAITAPALADFGAKTWGAVQEVSEAWPAEVRARFRVDFLGFPHWDALVFPLRELSDVGELNPIQIMRVSPRDATILGLPTEQKLRGVKINHFGAFFRRGWRENDYLWGRLDAAERLIRMVAAKADGTPLPCDDLCREAFAAILADERERLGKVRPLIDSLSAQVAPPAA